MFQLAWSTTSMSSMDNPRNTKVAPPRAEAMRKAMLPSHTFFQILYSHWTIMQGILRIKVTTRQVRLSGQPPGRRPSRQTNCQRTLPSTPCRTAISIRRRIFPGTLSAQPSLRTAHRAAKKRTRTLFCATDIDIGSNLVEKL